MKIRITSQKESHPRVLRQDNSSWGCDTINGSMGSFHLFILSCSLWLQKPSLGPLPPGSFLGAQGQPPCLFLVSSVTDLTSLCWNLDCLSWMDLSPLHEVPQAPLFYWNIVDLHCCVNFCCAAKWFSYTHIFFFHILFHYGLWQDIE